MADYRLLISRLREFNRARDWGQFHTPKNLAASLAIEVGELLEHFQWDNGPDPNNPEHKERIKIMLSEIADIQIYLAILADEYGTDPISQALEKVALNAVRYPADRARGKSDKYTNY